MGIPMIRFDCWGVVGLFDIADVKNGGVFIFYVPCFLPIYVCPSLVVYHLFVYLIISCLSTINCL